MHETYGLSRGAARVVTPHDKTRPWRNGLSRTVRLLSRGKAMALDNWLDDDVDEPDDTRRIRRKRLWYAAATVPWVLVIVIIFALRDTGSQPPSGIGIDDAHAIATGEPGAPGAPGSDPFGAIDGHPGGTMNSDDVAIGLHGHGSHAAPGAVPTDLYGLGHDDVIALQLQADWRQHPGAQAAAATAIVTAASWMSGELDITPAHFATEAVEMLDGRVAVVTTQAVTASGDVLRFGVTARIDGHTPRVVGEPWLLPELQSDQASLTTSALEEPQLHREAIDALVDAGYQDVQLHHLERTDSWPVFAHITARTPQGRPVTSPVVLRRHVGQFVLAGTVLPEGAAHTAAGWGQR